MRLPLVVWLSWAGCQPAVANPDAPPSPGPAPEPLAAPLAAEPPAPPCPLTVDDLPNPGAFDPADERLRDERVIVVDKAHRRAMLYERGALADGACWPVALGVSDDGTWPAGPKRQRGDRKTPEGWYVTSDRPWSAFYGAITIHYPNAADIDAGLDAGLITADAAAAMKAADRRGELPDQDTRLGGALLLHGGGSGADWTLGCVAFEDADIDALRARLPRDMRAPVLILP